MERNETEKEFGFSAMLITGCFRSRFSTENVGGVPDWDKYPSNLLWAREANDVCQVVSLVNWDPVCC